MADHHLIVGSVEICCSIGDIRVRTGGREADAIGIGAVAGACFIDGGRAAGFAQTPVTNGVIRIDDHVGPGRGTLITCVDRVVAPATDECIVTEATT